MGRTVAIGIQNYGEIIEKNCLRKYGFAFAGKEVLIG